MTELPRELSSSEHRISIAWLNRLLRAVRSRTLCGVGPGLMMTRTPTGTTLCLVPRNRGGGSSGASDGVVPAVVTDFNSKTGVYSVELHANGLSSASTGSAKLVLASVSMASRLPAGTVLLAHSVACEEYEIRSGS